MKTRLFFLHALTPLHVGVGQSLGVVDLPIMRERSTQLPIVPGSAVKGVLRDAWAQVQEPSPWAQAAQCIATLMGPKTDELAANAHAGALAFGDARTLLLPVRSLAGVAAWVTCPFVLNRYARDLAMQGGTAPPVPKVDQALLASDDAAVVFSVPGHQGQKTVLLEDLELPARHDGAARQWADHLAQAMAPLEGTWSDLLGRHLVLLPDDEFAFLVETATEIRARVRIDDKTRTVAEGALWYEENLPAETLLWGVLGVGPSRRPNDVASIDEVDRRLPAGQPLLLQIGGKQTVGRGLCQWMLN